MMNIGSSFSLGRIVLDRRSLRRLSSEDVIPALSRHFLGDWGAISTQRRDANRRALVQNKPVRSVYYTTMGTKMCVTTAGDRSVTTVKVL